MITCGRCGKPSGIGGYGNTFRIFESFMHDGQKFGRRTDLCEKCQVELIFWLNEGGYIEHRNEALPVRNTATEIVDLRNRLNKLIEQLTEDQNERQT